MLVDVPTKRELQLDNEVYIIVFCGLDSVPYIQTIVVGFEGKGTHKVVMDNQLKLQCVCVCTHKITTISVSLSKFKTIKYT